MSDTANTTETPQSTGIEIAASTPVAPVAPEATLPEAATPVSPEAPTESAHADPTATPESFVSLRDQLGITGDTRVGQIILSPWEGKVDFTVEEGEKTPLGFIAGRVVTTLSLSGNGPREFFHLSAPEGSATLALVTYLNDQLETALANMLPPNSVQG